MRRLAIALGGLAACDAASNDPGYHALVQVPRAQLRPGRFPADEGGPAVVSVVPSHVTVAPGAVGERYRGALAPGATSVILGVDGDDAAWIVTAGSPDIDTPDYPSFDVRAAFAAALPPGPFTLDVAAADETGRVGPTEQLALVADAVAPPTGALVVSLSWDGPVDLDLHVVDPHGGEAWSGDPNTWDPPPPGTPPDPDAWKTGGILDRDANGRCARDARPREDVAWQLPPPAGTYTVRVDTRAMCGGAVAYWYVAAYDAGGAVIAAARGISTPDDVSTYYGDGAGITAMTFTRP
jgi:hypothetical protein